VVVVVADRWSFQMLGVAALLVASAAAFRGGGWLLLWPATGNFLLAAAFFSGRPALLGKDPQGRYALPARLILLPYWLFLDLFHRLMDRRDHRFTAVEVAPGLLLGGYPGARPLATGVDLVVDVASELPRAVATRELEYLYVPCLNRRAPEAAALSRALPRLAAHRGRILIHCGAGKGRSAALAAAVLMARGEAESLDEAERLIRALRPGVALHPPQRRLVEELLTAFHAGHGSPSRCGPRR
jgi:hypothetical protein